MSSNKLVADLLEVIAKARWPGTHRTNGSIRAQYAQGLDMVNAFRGDPQIYVHALSQFQAIDSCAYAYAGIAYTLTKVSTQGENQIDPTGYNAALEWLEKAQEWEPNQLEINFIEAVLYIRSGQMENGRLILDHIAPAEPDNYYFCLTEMSYWRRLKRREKEMQWLKQTYEFATSSARQIYVINTLAAYRMKEGDFTSAIKHYHQVVKINPQDAMAWHNMSYMFLELGNVENAGMCNEKALGIMDFHAAREVGKLIQEKKPKGFFHKLRR